MNISGCLIHGFNSGFFIPRKNSFNSVYPVSSLFGLFCFGEMSFSSRKGGFNSVYLFSSFFTPVLPTLGIIQVFDV